MKDFKKYQNKLGWCNYPFENEPLGYCWSFACYIDNDLVVKNRKIDTLLKLEQLCKSCDCFITPKKLWKKPLTPTKR